MKKKIMLHDVQIVLTRGGGELNICYCITFLSSCNILIILNLTGLSGCIFDANQCMSGGLTTLFAT